MASPLGGKSTVAPPDDPDGADVIVAPRISFRNVSQSLRHIPERTGCNVALVTATSGVHYGSAGARHAVTSPRILRSRPLVTRSFAVMVQNVYPLDVEL
jgi:hypothetical protein